MSKHAATKIPAPCGSWESPISPAAITAGSIGRDHPCMVAGHLYWQESRPEEQGRTTVVVRYPDGACADLLAAPFSVQSKVHEYGGRAWLVAGGSLFFVDKADQRVYRMPLPDQGSAPFSAAASPLTPPDAALRFADFCFDGHGQRLLAVCEDHSAEHEPPRNYLVVIPLDGSGCADNLEILTQGSDFYAYPRISPDGAELCWIAWNQPQMPWDGSELHCAPSARPHASTVIAGGVSEAIFQPEWSPNGILHFVSDRTGWWNLYRYHKGEIQPLRVMEAEFATPLWALGMSTYDFLSESRIACTYTRQGRWHLGVLDTDAGSLHEIPNDFTQIHGLSCAQPHHVFFIGASPLCSGDVVCVDTARETLESVVVSQGELAPADISQPQNITFDTTDGDIAHGIYYPPTNAAYRVPDTEKPPLIVVCHGGPTGANYPVLNYKLQYWTSRGFAVLDVNYRGSTGYGRRYREKLNGNWGVVDVEDAAAGARYLAGQGLADAGRTIIRGSSAGGFTVLAALTFSGVFRAGASLYGIGDLEALARDTHKFEARYLDTLVGDYPAQKARYQARSPIHFPEQLDCPVIFFQGLEDKVVPPSQAQAMVAALQKKAIPVAYVTFADEGHGFRKAANIRVALEAELYFYRRIFSIEDREHLPKIPIDNMP
ncbi:MAG: prolyl oligopeptidase family serine peptidase [Porticoccaceae bacterium]